MRKHVNERRERLRKLGEQDASNRCSRCHRAVPWKQQLHSGIVPGMFCAFDCLLDAEAEYFVTHPEETR